MGLIAAATLGASAISGGLGYFASKDASKKQYDAAMQGLDFQKSVFARNNQNAQPYLDIGQHATSSLASLYGFPGSGNEGGQVDWGRFLGTPDYQFSQQQGMLGLDRSLASKGLTQSGAAARAGLSFSQGLASQQFGNYFQRMLSLSGLGQSAAAALAGTSTQAGSNIAGAYGNAGQAQASGIIGGANAVSGSIGSGVNNLMLYSALNKGPSSYGGGTPMNITPPTVGAPSLGSAGGTGGGLGGLY